MSRKKKPTLPVGNIMANMDETEIAQLRFVAEGILRSRRSTKFEKGHPITKGKKHPLLGYAQIMQVCQTNELTVAMKILQSAAAGQPNGDRDKDLEIALAHLAELKPANSIEAILMAQMIAVNDAISRAMSEACSRENSFDTHNWLNSSAKLQRTFLIQLDALQKLRGKGQQTVRVEHVTVAAGGQAIIGNVEHHQVEGGGENGNRELPHVQRPQINSLWSENPERELVPAAGHSREKTLPAARREEQERL